MDTHPVLGSLYPPNPHNSQVFSFRLGRFFWLDGAVAPRPLPPTMPYRAAWSSTMTTLLLAHVLLLPGGVGSAEHDYITDRGLASVAPGNDVMGRSITAA